MFSKWNRITVDELKAFLGFHILMAMNHLPSLDDYWRRDPLLHYAPIADRITRDRYRELSRYLHFADNDTLAPRGSPGYDRLGKVRPVIDHLSMKFAELYQPHCEVAIDEAMIKFQGRSSLKQYNPMKPVKRGIKVWVLADSHNGYFKKFQVYTGKDENRVEHGLGERVVKTLTANCTENTIMLSSTISSPVRSFCKICWPMVCTHVEPQERIAGAFRQP